MVILDWCGFEYEVVATIFSEVVISMSLSDIITNYGRKRGPSKGSAIADPEASGLNTIKGQLQHLVDHLPGGSTDQKLGIEKAARLAVAFKKKAKKVWKDIHRIDLWKGRNSTVNYQLATLQYWPCCVA